MTSVLLDKIKTAHRKSLDGWTDVRMVDRGIAYLNRVRDIVDCGEFLAGCVKGTTNYKTNVFLDGKGELESVCTCPVGYRCKHAVALILAAQQRINTDNAIPVCADVEALEVERERKPVSSQAKTEEPVRQPEVVEHILVTENPFDCWTENGGRHGKDFSFRVAYGTYDWFFIIPSLIYALAKGGLDFTDSGPMWWDEGAYSDPPLFTCGCGDTHCGGLGPQRMTFSETKILLSVVEGLDVVEFEFAREKFEYWVMLMLWRMRGSARMRKDPWDSVVEKGSFDAAVNRLLDINPRCRAIWRRLSAKRKFGEDDFAAIAKLPSKDAERFLTKNDLMEFFVREFTTRDKGDLSKNKKALWREKKEVEHQMEKERMKKLTLTIYSFVIGHHWQLTDLQRNEKIVFERGAGDDYNSHSIRVESETRGVTIGYLKRSDAYWLTSMMDRHGLVLEGHVEELERDGKSIPIQVDLSFKNPEDLSFNWGAGLQEKDRLYFEMLRTLALHIGEYSVLTVRTEIETINRLIGNNSHCAEIDFLIALIISGVKAEEFRLTDVEVGKRLTYCDNVRKAMSCEPIGGFVDFEGMRILPLRALCASKALTQEEAISRVTSWVRLCWGRETERRPQVKLSLFPPEATGFALFRGSELLDICLLGHPIAGTNLFDNFALYEQGCGGEGVSVIEAFALVEKFLRDLPVRERDENGCAPRFWYEKGIHDGEYDLDEDGRLLGLRIVMMSARKQWVD